MMGDYWEGPEYMGDTRTRNALDEWRAMRHEPARNRAERYNCRMSKGEETPVSVDNYRANLEATMTQAAAALARLDATPDPGEYANGSVFFVRRQYATDGATYSYAYVKAAGSWYGTGRTFSGPVSDQEFRRWLMREDVREISVAIDWALLAGEAEEIEDEGE